MTFRRLVIDADAAEPHDVDLALRLLVEALELWCGPVAAGVDETVRSAPTFVHIDTERSMAATRAATLALQTGGRARILP